MFLIVIGADDPPMPIPGHRALADLVSCHLHADFPCTGEYIVPLFALDLA